MDLKILTEKQFLRVTDIMRVLNCGYEKAKKSFDKAKGHDRDIYQIRPFEVSSEIWINSEGLSLAFIKQQLELKALLNERS